MKISTFKELAEYCEETYGVHYNREEEFFICPECGEPIYADDWEWEDFIYQETSALMCPICEFILN